MRDTVNIHATGLLLGETGLLIRGRSGAGKSLLALELLDRWQSRGATALLVSDDRVDLALCDGLPTMAAPASIAGLIELRGRGIVSRPHVAAGHVHLVVDLVESLTRMLEEDELVTELLGVVLPRCPVPERGVIDSNHQMLLIAEAIGALPVAGGPDKPAWRSPLV